MRGRPPPKLRRGDKDSRSQNNVTQWTESLLPSRLLCERGEEDGVEWKRHRKDCAPEEVDGPANETMGANINSFPYSFVAAARGR